jgi:histidyl-tRNA synthetase
LFVNYGPAEALYALQAIKQLRAKNIAVELYPDPVKMGKQFAHADKREIPYVVIAGSDEMQNGTYALKNLAAGTQEVLTLDQLIVLLAN